MARKQQLFDFKDGNGPVPAHQHKKGGGWVANSAYVAPTAYLGPRAQVFGRAGIYCDAEVHDDVRVRGVAQIWDDVVLRGNAEVQDAGLHHLVRLHEGVVVRGMNTILAGDFDLYGPLVIDATPFIITSSYAHPVVLVRSPKKMVSVGCETYSLAYWRGNLRLIARRDLFVLPKDLRLFRQLLDAVYGPVRAKKR